jgi:hypothetical protein
MKYDNMQECLVLSILRIDKYIAPLGEALPSNISLTKKQVSF